MALKTLISLESFDSLCLQAKFVGQARALILHHPTIAIAERGDESLHYKVIGVGIHTNACNPRCGLPLGALHKGPTIALTNLIFGHTQAVNCCISSPRGEPLPTPQIVVGSLSVVGQHSIGNPLAISHKHTTNPQPHILFQTLAIGVAILPLVNIGTSQSLLRTTHRAEGKLHIANLGNNQLQVLHIFHKTINNFRVIFTRQTLKSKKIMSKTTKKPSKKAPTPLFLDFMESQIQLLNNSGRIGTAINYTKALNSFRNFLGKRNPTIASINEYLIDDYNAYLVGRGLVRNSISFYMRILRAVYNKAVRLKLTRQRTPFTEVYTGVDQTRKRAVEEDTIVRLHHLKLRSNSPLPLARDIFLFSYFTRGMPFVDIAYLRKSNLQAGSICYIRRKTKQLMSVKIEPCIKRIIDRYSTPESPYLFPIITATTPEVAYQQYRNGLHIYNRALRKLSKMVGCEQHLTSYTSRHSWATAARNQNIPLSVISAAMGHTSEQTTRIYLASLENSVIDDANQRLLAHLGQEFF